MSIRRRTDKYIIFKRMRSSTADSLPWGTNSSNKKGPQWMPHGRTATWPAPSSHASGSPTAHQACSKAGPALCHVRACSVIQLCPTLCDPVDCSPPGSSVHWILQQEYWSVLPCPPPGDLEPRNQTRVSYICIDRQVSYHQSHLATPREQGESCIKTHRQKKVWFLGIDQVKLRVSREWRRKHMEKALERRAGSNLTGRDKEFWFFSSVGRLKTHYITINCS